MKKLHDTWRRFWAPRTDLTPEEAAEVALRSFPKCC